MKGPTFCQTTDNATIVALVNTLFDDGDSICVGYQNRLCVTSPLGLVATLKGSDTPNGWPCFNTNDPVVFSINPSEPSNKGGLPIDNVWAGRSWMFEADNLSFDEQINYWTNYPVIKDMPFTLIFTGNKSMHAILTLDMEDSAAFLGPMDGERYSQYTYYHRLICVLLDHKTTGGLRLDTATCTPNRTTKAPNFTREIYRPGSVETSTVAPKVIRVGRRVTPGEVMEWMKRLVQEGGNRYRQLEEQAQRDLKNWGTRGSNGVSR